MILDTPQQIQVFRLMTMQRALIFDVDHAPMKMTGRPYLPTMQAEGLTNKRNKRGALRDLNGFFVLNGREDMVKWTTKYPNDKPTKWAIDKDDNGDVFAFIQ